MQNVPLRLSAVVVCTIALFCCPTAALAQVVDGGYDPGANQIVNTIAVQPDGKIVVGGNFTGLGGTTGTTTRNRIGRLNTDGTVDALFNPGTSGPVLAVAVQPDGKILAGGNFLSVGGGTGLTHARSNIARFNADGTVDTSFNPGANLNVKALAVQPDGKILVGGNFSTLGGATRIAIGRLNADGTIDDAFNPGASKLPSGAVPEIYTIVVQPDGNILVGGYFNGLGGGTGTTPRNFLGRLLANGDVDSFNPGVTSISGVNALALQADGMIIVGGTYTQLAGVNRKNIGRLDANGALDIGFNPGTETQVLTLGVQTDGKILAGGYFKWLGDDGGANKSTRNYIGRLNADGSVDASFDPGANNVVNAVALQGNGGIVAGGVFSALGNGPFLTGGTPRNRIGRITNTDAGVQTLTLTGNGTIETWLRSGGGPEVSRVTFEFSFDGSFYSLLGNGSRISGGWQLTSVNLPSTRRVYVRARGYHETGQNGSGSIVESILILGRATYDFDGDGRSDISVFRPSNGTWYVNQSSSSTTSAVPFGVSGDVPVPGDYDGDGRSDVSVFRPANGTWFIQRSTAGLIIFQFGVAGDVPVPADYDGDLLTDVAVYRPSTSQWFILQSSTSTFTSIAFGLAGDIPVPADYDGDGQADVAVFRTGEWFIRQSSTSATVNMQFGLNGDVPVPGDYDGDGEADIAIFRPTTGNWYVLQSSTSTFVGFQFGAAGDIAQPGDYDGDGTTDIAVYRPNSGTWYIQQSTAGLVVTQFGAPGDMPVPSSVMTNAMNGVQPDSLLANLLPFNDFDGDERADITVYRPSVGTWFTLKSSANYTTSTSMQFGASGDLPVPGDYDGDSKADIAVFRNGTWYILKSSDSTFSAQQFGISSDIPAPGDYDGDGKIDIAVFRNGTWYILRSTGGFVSHAWGATGDIPVTGDYDGDGISDLAVFRPSTGAWYILKSSGSSLQFQWGVNGDIAVPGDFDGDGKTDLAVYRPSTGTWYVSQNPSGSPTSLIKQFGLTGDIPVAGDYDGDGKTDIAIFRPSTGTWFQLLSGSNYTTSATYQFGQSGDVPILKRP